ncbi:MAG: cysteine desulfurase [Bacilli bacterium]|jgi:cysteine desulfurase|nr:cysteine desulfurase [Bacilli bacterium]
MIYFDNAATTPTLKEAEKAFLDANRAVYANPSSSHAFGRESLRMLNEARTSILSLLGLDATHDMLFTSGATESNNLAIKGLAYSYRNRGNKIITSSVEHPSVTNAFLDLKEQGFDVVFLPVNENGVVEEETLNNAIDSKTILVSIMSVNNEVGSINDISSLAEIVHKYPKAFFHVDTTQSMGKIRLDYRKADLISFSGHKFGSFKGLGGLIYKNNIRFHELNSGGEQEYGFRAGTVNMPGDVSMAKALEVSYQNMSKNIKIVTEIRDFLRDNLAKRGDVVINSPVDATPYVLNFSLKKKKASVVLEALSSEGIYVSSVSACSSKGEPVSEVLLSMGLERDLAMSSIRLSFSHDNTMEEARIFLSAFDKIMKEVVDR